MKKQDYDAEFAREILSREDCGRAMTKPHGGRFQAENKSQQPPQQQGQVTPVEPRH